MYSFLLFLIILRTEANNSNITIQIVASTKDTRFEGGLSHPRLDSYGRIFFLAYDSKNQSLFKKSDSKIERIVTVGAGPLVGYDGITDYVLDDKTAKISLSVQDLSGDTSAIFSSSNSSGSGVTFQMNVKSGMHIPSDSQIMNSTFGGIGSPRTGSIQVVFGGVNCTNQECVTQSKLSGLFVTRPVSSSEDPTILMTIVSSNMKNPSFPSSGSRYFDMFGGSSVSKSGTFCSFFGTSSASNMILGYLELTPYDRRVDPLLVAVEDNSNDVASPGIFLVRLDDASKNIEVIADSSLPWPSSSSQHRMIAFSDPILSQDDNDEDSEIVFVAKSNMGVYGIFSYSISTQNLRLVVDTNNTQFSGFPFLPSIMSGRLMFQAVTQTLETALFVASRDNDIHQVLSCSDIRVSNDTTPFVYMLFTEGGFDGCKSAVLYASSEEYDYILQLSSLSSPSSSLLSKCL